MGSTSQQGQAGVRALKLLAEEWMVAIMRGLARGSLRPAELERDLADGGHSAVMRRLRHLLDSELVSYERRPGLPPHGRSAAIPRQAHYNLTDAGRTLLAVPTEAARWERRWRPQADRGAAAGVSAIRLLADDHARKILLLLADGPLRTDDLDERALDLGRSALRRRLRDLGLAGLLERSERKGGPRYELTAAARRLAPVARSAGCWESRWAPAGGPARGRGLDESRWWDALLERD
jgi:DNA-binding HxlR family transcriptional regulator